MAFRISSLKAKVLLVVVVLSAILVGIVFAVIWPIEIDTCLDRGGCWDATNNRCEFEDQSKCRPLTPP